MRNWLLFLYHRLKEQLWAKPVAICGLAVAGVFVAKAADQLAFALAAPDVTLESVETLLKVIAASMLVMAIFAVGSMVSAYASASNNATPRAFPLVIADDVSQNALTAFIGAFIFSIVALFALQNGYYGQAGRFTLLLLTFVVFAVVILTFVWWVDRIARLGRLGTAIEKVESATAAALRRRRRTPRLGGSTVGSRDGHALAIFGESIGYVQHVKVPPCKPLPRSAMSGLRSQPFQELSLPQPDHWRTSLATHSILLILALRSRALLSLAATEHLRTIRVSGSLFFRRLPAARCPQASMILAQQSA